MLARNEVGKEKFREIECTGYRHGPEQRKKYKWVSKNNKN